MKLVATLAAATCLFSNHGLSQTLEPTGAAQPTSKSGFQNPVGFWAFGTKESPSTRFRLQTSQTDSRGAQVRWVITNHQTSWRTAQSSSLRHSNWSIGPVCLEFDNSLPATNYATARFIVPPVSNTKLQLKAVLTTIDQRTPVDGIEVRMIKDDQLVEVEKTVTKDSIAIAHTFSPQSASFIDLLVAPHTRPPTFNILALKLEAVESAEPPQGGLERLNSTHPSPNCKSRIRLGASTYIPPETIEPARTSNSGVALKGSARFTRDNHLYFDGIDDSGTVSLDELKDSESFSIEIRPTIETLDRVNTIISVGSDSANSESIELRTSPRGTGALQIRALVGTSDIRTLESQPGLLRAGYNHHIVMTFGRDKSSCTVFLDGNQVFSLVSPSLSGSHFQHAHIGTGASYSLRQLLRGLITHLAIYKRTLTEQEVFELFNCGDRGGIPADESLHKPHIEPAKLVASWSFNDHLRDNNGDLDTSPARNALNVSYSKGILGSALNLNSTGGAVEVAASDKLDVGSGSAMTVQFWARPHTSTRNQPLIEWDEGVHIWIGVDLHVDGDGDGNVFANLVDIEKRSHHIHSAPRKISSGEWIHITLTYNRNKGVARLYLNGKVAAEEMLGSFQPNTKGPMKLGIRSVKDALAGRRFNGELDEVRLYSGELTAEEIADSSKRPDDGVTEQRR